MRRRHRTDRSPRLLANVAQTFPGETHLVNMVRRVKEEVNMVNMVKVKEEDFEEFGRFLSPL